MSAVDRAGLAVRAVPLFVLAVGLVAPLARALLPALGAAMHDALGPLCHQDPARCPTLAGEAAALCFRCVGLWAGAALVALGGLRRASTRTGLSLFALGVLDWALKLVAFVPDHPLERLVTGAALGAGLAILAGNGLARAPRRIEQALASLRRALARGRLA